MKVEYLQPFVKSLVANIEGNTGDAPVKEKMYLREKYPYTMENVAIIVGVTGDLTGQVILSLPLECALHIARKMLMETALDELDEYAQSALSELANMIIANATIELSEAGFTCDITPPTIITGQRMEMSCPEPIKTLVVVFRLEATTFEMNIAMIESNLLVKPERKSV